LAFPIVAIGASAGGLEALSELLGALLPKSDMAFIVVQHLSADHASLLPELLGKKTTLPVEAIVDGTAVQANRVYVIPPNTTLTIKDDRLQLRQRDHDRPHHPVDILFLSLAEARAESAIGIVLSGGDGDGSLGVQSIKHQGGITFAQEPSSARIPSMPQHAINTGCIDFVLRPADIARELSRLRSHPYLRVAKAPPEQVPDESRGGADEEQLTRIFRRVRLAHGVDFAHYKPSTIRRRLARRMAVRKIDHLSDYMALLDSEPAEVGALYQDFLIRVTHFFRDPQVFEALRSGILPKLCEGRSAKEPLRIWVPGCSTGEEVYSIAMALMEHLGDRSNAYRIQIFGSDVSEGAIEKARAGLYLNTIAEDVSPERLERFFATENSQYRIARQLRDMCIFSRQDITRDPPFSRLDLLSCRNVLIYLDAAAQRRVMQVFHYALRPTGFLMLGPSETVGASSDLFELIDKTNRTYTRKVTPGTALQFPAQAGLAEGAAQQRSSGTESILAGIESAPLAADRLLLSEYAPASLLVDEALNILQIRGETGRFLELASGVPSLNLNRVVRPELLIEIAPAMAEVRETGTRVRREGLRVDDLTDITLQVIPLKVAMLEPNYLIILEDASRRPSGRHALPPDVAAVPESEKDRRLAQLEREVVAAHQYMHTVLEEHAAIRVELKLAHEEVLSANEEYQSTNEELETAKEELQSANEELVTTNDELRDRNRQLSLLNDDVLKARTLSERARQYAEAIVETVREPLIVMDGDLRILRANHAFYFDFKSRREDIEGKLLEEIGASQWNAPGLIHKVGAVVKENEALKNYDLSYSIVAGSAPRTLRVNARKIVGNTDRAEMILLAIEDITERKASAAQLREANQRKDEFLAMLAHELRNPLTPITHAMVLLRGNGAHSPTDLYDLIDRQTARLIRLVDELVDVARISRGYIELKQEVVDFADVIRHAINASRARIEERQHRLSMTLPDHSVWVHGDAVRLEQVVSNLLENAAKYTEPGGYIGLALTEANGETLLSVRDNGIGIASERLEDIFGLFTQVDSSLARSRGGLGIGLTLVRRLLTLHQGQIEARSAGLGQGSEFLVRLPVVPAPSAQIVRRREGKPQATVSRRVLVVDDNADAAESMAMVVRAWGHEVVVARDGPTALNTAKHFLPERALVDIGLPGMDGYEVARRLRAAPEHSNLFLVAVTGYGRDEDREKAYAAGFDMHMVKPGDLEELQDMLENGAARSRRPPLLAAEQSGIEP
jgi:two-component system, chemotaxis family, CheB/CheR fusion protein